jgi:hypothetical protein
MDRCKKCNAELSDELKDEILYKDKIEVSEYKIVNYRLEITKEYFLCIDCFKNGEAHRGDV